MAAYSFAAYSTLAYSTSAYFLEQVVVKGMQPFIGRKPVRRTISIKSISIALSGPEEPYPHYQFSNRQFLAKPNHNPFKGL